MVDLPQSAWITSVIEDFIANSPENNLQNRTGEKAFENPLVGFAGGADPIFDDYKTHVGPFHWTPLEIFRTTFAESCIEAGDLTVISWILPQTSRTRADNRKQDRFPAERWARARVFGEKVNEKLRAQVVCRLEERGIQAVAPMLSPGWSREISPRYGYASKWSERHAAYAAGLGTFGLCDGLITEKGKAMRTGSVVARCRIQPSPRPFTDHHAYCLFYAKGTCGKCIERCPVGAISEKGHDKEKCKAYMRGEVVRGYIKEHYGFEGKGCGLCQTKVPCEAVNPVRSQDRKA
ncbi:MAG: epoxyqueuosine reductase [Desulfobacterales bacterium]|nr:epoxyqueuosine reductase [Desulfobacterales bacterium]